MKIKFALVALVVSVTLVSSTPFLKSGDFVDDILDGILDLFGLSSSEEDLSFNNKNLTSELKALLQLKNLFQI